MRQQPELKITSMKVSELVPYAGNAKEHPYEQIEQIAQSIEEFGNCDPVAVWHNDEGEPEIVEGHGRVMALKRLGIDTVPVITLDHLTDEQRRAYTIIHNQTTMNSGFDIEILQSELDALDFDFEDYGLGDAFDDYEEFVDMNVSNAEEKESSIHKLRVDGKTYVIAEDEATMLSEYIEQYAEDNGLPYGAIRSLFND